jgi:hypothetical protein
MFRLSIHDVARAQPAALRLCFVEGSSHELHLNPCERIPLVQNVAQGFAAGRTLEGPEGIKNYWRKFPGESCAPVCAGRKKKVQAARAPPLINNKPSNVHTQPSSDPSLTHCHIDTNTDTSNHSALILLSCWGTCQSINRSQTISINQ